MKEKVLSLLKESGEYISGEQISEAFGVSRSAVWKAVKALRQEGYEIDSVTNKGYRLVKMPNILSSAQISQGLDTQLVGSRIAVIHTVDSTNDEVKRQAANGADSGLVVIAEEQTAGKGRLGRSWKSAPGGIYFSILLRPELAPADVPGITLAVGLAVCLAIREFTGCEAMIKWPNDIIIGRKKICGILTEMAAQTDMVDYVVVGAGINVNNKSFAPEISQKATSLYIETGGELELSKLMQSVLKHIDERIGSYLTSVSIDDAKLYKSLCATIGRNVSLERGDKKIEGTATDITFDGKLIITLADGSTLEVGSGEVTVQGIY